MKQVIYMIGAAALDRRDDVIASPKSHKRLRKMRQKQERDLAGHYGDSIAGRSRCARASARP
jgi:hypothetical protein